MPTAVPLTSRRAQRLPERDIRIALLRRLQDVHEKEQATLILEELGILRGRARIDVAVLNGSLHGYEIASDFDTLRRVHYQLPRFADVCDELTFVVGREHYEAIVTSVPMWCGIIVAVQRQSVEFILDRHPTAKPVDAIATAKLLWRDEAESLLRTYGHTKIPRNRTDLAEAVARAIDLRTLRADVLGILKQRAAWRPVRLRTSSDD